MRYSGSPSVLVGNVVMMSFKEFLKKRYPRWYPDAADRVVVFVDGVGAVLLEEGKWVKASFEKEIRVDRATHLQSGDKHAHIHDRKGNELYALTQNGKPSHGSKPFRLSKDQATALEKQGFAIPKNRIVEGILVSTGRMLLLG